MARIPLEDNYDDVLKKAQAGLALPDEELSRRAEVPAADLAAVMGGNFNEAVARRLATHLRLNRDALVQLALKRWYPTVPVFRMGFAAFNTPFRDGSVNSYLVWDSRSRQAAAFDTGTTSRDMVDLIASEGLHLRYIFLTHTHPDHVADIEKLASSTKAEIWASEREPSSQPGSHTFAENAFFHLGALSIKTLLTSGHSPGGTTFYVTGLSYPLALVGDALFASSMGGASPEVYSEARDHVFKKILTLPADTVLGCGHGPLTTVAQERKNNPFFVR